MVTSPYWTGGGAAPQSSQRGDQARERRAILDPQTGSDQGRARRAGKSTILIALAADEAIRGRPVGYFCPLFRIATPVFDALALVPAPAGG